MKSRAKLLRWLAIITGGFLILFALFLIEERIRGRIELNRYVQQMRARGERFTIAELTPSPAFPTENGAGLMLGAGFPTWGIVPQQIPNAMRYVSAGKAIPAVTIRAWSVSGQQEMRLGTNTYATAGPGDTPIADTVTNGPPARRRRGGSRGPANAKEWKIVTGQDLADEIAANSNSLARVRAALAYPQLDHSLPYWQGFTLLLPHLSRDKVAAQWLRAASFSALQQTNIVATLENLRALAALSHATTNEVLIISQLVRIAILHIVVGATWEALQAEGWNDVQLEELQHALAPNDFVFAMTRALEMDRAMGAAMIDQIAQDPALLKSLLGMDVADLDFGWIPQSLPESADDVLEPFRNLIKNLMPGFNRFIYYPIWSFAWKDQDKLNLMRYWQEHINRGRFRGIRPNWTANKTNDDKIAEGGAYIDRSPPVGYHSVYNRARFMVSSFVEGAIERVLEKATTAEAAQQLAVTAIAIHRFELAHHENPDSLDQLVPKFLPAIPFDPFDSQPLRYKRERDGTFTLYSVGQNGKDDKGNASRLQANIARPDFINGQDLVWPHAAMPEEVQEFIEAAAGRSRKSTAP